ncbi:MAG: hypothetical protein IKS01_05205 [Paludibacteraceae bacterium]|nr:hypothetical protein [Paludibacteraceae bacterium]
MLNVKKLLKKILDAIKADYVVEQGENTYGTYRKWNSGVLEQWGAISASASGGNVTSTIQFPTSFFDKSYSVELTPRRNFGASMSISESNSAGNAERTTDTTKVTWWKSGNAYATEISFHAIGKWK